MLNAVTQQVNNKDKSVQLKAKKAEMKKIINLESSKGEISEKYKDIDRDVTLIMRMDNQQLKNLHKLDNYKVLLN